MKKEKIDTKKIVRDLCEELKKADEYERGYLIGFINGLCIKNPEEEKREGNE